MAFEIDPQILQIAAEAASEFVLESIKKAKIAIRDQNAVQRGMQQYAKRFLERHGQVKILGMSEPVPLRDIYTAAQVVSPNFLHRFRTPDDLQEVFLQQGRHHFLDDSKGSRRDGLELANKVQFLNVLGAPGAGKSTFLRRLGLEALLPRRKWGDSVRASFGMKARLLAEQAGQYDHDCLPVLIELRRFRTEEIKLPLLIRDELSACGLPESERLAEALLENGNLLLLLDGLDEIPGDKLDQALSHLRDCADLFERNRFVTSCRTAFYKDFLPRFADVLLADFDSKQVTSFVHNWFRSEEDRQRNTAKAFLELLAEPAHKATQELANTPLLLTFLCLNYDDRQRLPTNRSVLYRQALEILLERWAASKRVHNEPVYGELHAELEVQMLTEIAAPAFSENRYFLTREELVGSIGRFLQDELNAPRKLNASQVLEAIEIQQGLIVQRAQDVYSFSHLTLQEYLTAVWYVSNHRLEELTYKHLLDARWREVFLLVAGSVSKADELLVEMQKVTGNTLASAPQAIQLLTWAKEKGGITGDSTQLAARRAVAITLASALFRAFNRALVFPIDPGSDPYPYSLDPALTLALALDLELDDNFVKTLTNISRALNLNLSASRIREINGAADIDAGVVGDQTGDPSIGLVRKLAFDIKAVISLLEAINWSQVANRPLHDATQRLRTAFALLNGDFTPDALNAVWRQLPEMLTEVADALLLPASLYRLDPQTVKVLQDYLAACRFVVSCKQAAMRVSRSAWDKVCRLMLMPPAKAK